MSADWHEKLELGYDAPNLWGRYTRYKMCENRVKWRKPFRAFLVTVKKVIKIDS